MESLIINNLTLTKRAIDLNIYWDGAAQPG